MAIQQQRIVEVCFFFIYIMRNEGNDLSYISNLIQYAIGQAATTYHRGSVDQLPQDPDSTVLNLPKLDLSDRTV